MPSPHPALPSASNKINVLLVGGGGREHALAWRLKKSPSIAKLFTTHPENPGIAALATPVGFAFSTSDYRLELFCKEQNIGLVVIGPEGPLAEGLADKLASSTTAVFGPGKEAAQLESDKAWAKEVMRSASIPTAEGRVFRDAAAAIRYLESRDTSHVVKACGLASGKGVVVAQSLSEARDAVDRIMVKRQFGAAGDKVLIEERLTGKEVSVFALTDGRNVVILDPCQDHKRLLDNDEGPNTGGMGAFCPAGTIDARTMAVVQREVVVPTIDALRRDGLEFRGLLYCGLMLTPGGPKVLEFNVRFGDPECQCLVRRMGGDWVRLLHGAATGRLHEVADQAESSHEHVCCVVLASRGYPSNPESGREITGIEDAEKVEGVTVFHAGTAIDKLGRLVTAGGRVLNVVAVGATLDEARSRAMTAAEKINFEGKQLRSDIGLAPVPKERGAKTVTPRGVRAG